MIRVCILVCGILLVVGCAVAPTPTVPPNTATPTTPTSTATATATATSTSTPTQTPTNTLTPTSTATPTVTATSTPAATPTPVPSPTIAVRYPPVSLREPPDNQKRETTAITFEWEDIGLRVDGDGYMVLVRRAQNPTWEKTFYAGVQRKVVWGREQNIGYGDFMWTAVVVDAKGQIVSGQSAPRKFNWCHPRSGCQECSACHR